jgi:hypothetical protein
VKAKRLVLVAPLDRVESAVQTILANPDEEDIPELVRTGSVIRFPEFQCCMKKINALNKVFQLFRQPE